MGDSKRKTANLFDKDNTTIYSAYFDQSGSWLLSADSKSVKMPCQPNTQYTLSVPNSLAVFRVYESNNLSIEPSLTSPPRATEITRGTNISQYTFTTSSTAQIILFQGSNGTVTEWFNGLMLNTGSTPLPFEPYGWLHSLRKLTTATDTITTLPVDLYADGNNATVGLVGNMQQTGTPTPQNPIPPQETGERTGNLADLYNVNRTRLNLTFTTGNNMTVVINGTKADGVNVIPIAEPNVILPAGTYTVTIKMISGSITNTSEGAFFGINGSTYSQRTTPSVKEIGDVGKRTFTLSEDTLLSSLDIAPSYSNTGSVWNDATFECMLYSGSDDIPYEPYGYKILISSTNTTTPVYLGEVQTTRKIGKYVFTGEESWSLSGSGYFYSTNSFTNYNHKLVSQITTKWSHYIAGTNNSNGQHLQNGYACLYCHSTSAIASEIYIHDERYSTATDFKTYLQQQYANGTPVCVWYVLAEPTTGIVNEPIRKIGNYVDTVSGISIPTTTGKDTFDVLTTLKPSEVSLSYTGWHGASVGEWDGSEWQ